MKAGRGVRNRLLASLLGAAAALVGVLSVPPAASGEIPFCLPGSGAGQCIEPEGIAVDTALERIYVVDRSNHRVNVFDTIGEFEFAFGWGVDDGSAALQTCTTASGCQKGIAGAGAGQFSEPRRLAVDPASHAIYVGTDNFRVQKFKPTGEFERMWGWDVVASGPGDDTTAPIDEFEVCVSVNGDVCKAGVEGSGVGAFGGERNPIAVDPAGLVYVGDKPSGDARIEKFGPTGAFIEELPLPMLDTSLTAITVDSTGDFYVYAFISSVPGIHKYHPDGTEYGEPYPLDPSDSRTTSLSIGSADTLFAGQNVTGIEATYRPIVLYDSSGAILSRFGYGPIPTNIEGLAAFEDGVFAADREEGIEFLSAPPPGPLVVPLSVKAPEATLSNTKAVFKAEVNPEGKETTYRFDYLDQENFEAQGNSFVGPATKSTGAKPLPGTVDFHLHGVQEPIGCNNPLVEAGEGKCLTPETEYRFRIVATNADGDDEVEGEFTTRPASEILDTWSTEVGVDTARLNAEVNPLDIPTTGYFEYVEEYKFQESGFSEAIQAPDVGGGETPLDFKDGEAPLVRSASLDGLKPQTAYRYRVIVTNPLVEPITGPERGFKTFAPITTPPEPCSNEALRTGLSAFLPDCRAYELVSPLDKNSGDVIPLEEPSFHLPAALDLSSTSGEKLTYGSYRAFGTPEGAGYTPQYIAARDEEDGWLTHNISPPRGAPTLKQSPGLQLNTEFKAFSPDLCQAWLRTITEPQLEPFAVKGFANVYRRDDQECGAKSWEAQTRVAPPDRPAELYYPLELQGVSADGSHSIYLAPDNLTEGAPNPGESTSEIESDNSQLYEWDGTQTRFVCILPGGTPHTGSCSAGTADNANGDSRTATLQNAISADGSRVFWTATFGNVGPGKIYVRIGGAETVAVSAQAEALEGTSSAQYWTAAKDGSIAIFETGGSLYAFDVDDEVTTGIALSGVLGVIGASEDAARVYFASSAALTGEEANSEGDKAQAGEPNLYLSDEGETSFIGTLAGADLNPIFQRNPAAAQPRSRTSRVSADGEHTAFMSAASLTGYDNTDANSGKANAEAFLYDAGSEELICASCNPSGARPVGINIGDPSNQYWAAGEIPVWQNTLHSSGALAEDGSRLYFQSTDVLVPRDTNGAQDVYQWEEEGAGTCDEADPGFYPDSNGCIELISSGKSDRVSEFVDADPTGENVFIRALDSLVPQDYGLVDIYDARVGGGFEPPPPLPPGCEGEACQSTPPPPQAPTPASSNEGPGNVVEARTKPRRRACPKGKRRVTKAGKTRCVKRQKRKRASHSGRATR